VKERTQVSTVGDTWSFSTREIADWSCRRADREACLAHVMAAPGLSQQLSRRPSPRLNHSGSAIIAFLRSAEAALQGLELGVDLVREAVTEPGEVLLHLRQPAPSPRALKGRLG